MDKTERLHKGGIKGAGFSTRGTGRKTRTCEKNLPWKQKGGMYKSGRERINSQQKKKNRGGAPPIRSSRKKILHLTPSEKKNTAVAKNTGGPSSCVRWEGNKTQKTENKGEKGPETHSRGRAFLMNNMGEPQAPVCSLILQDKLKTGHNDGGTNGTIPLFEAKGWQI